MSKTLKIFGLILIIILFIFFILDGSYKMREYALIWDNNYVNSLETDQEKIIAGAITAASAHNMQPWLVAIQDDYKIDLYADTSKHLEVIDSNYKLMQISLGAFIKNYETYAYYYGYDLMIEYHSADFNQEQPKIASLTLIRNESLESIDILSSSSILNEDNGPSLSLAETIQNVSNEYPAFDIQIINKEKLNPLKEILIEASLVESREKAAIEEMMNIIRFTERDKNKYRFGLTLNTIPGPLKPFIQPILKLTLKDWQAFAESGVDMFNERLEKEHTYLLITADEESINNYLLTGMIYQDLFGQLSNYSIRPSVQVIEDFKAMNNLTFEFQEIYGNDGVVTLIIGVQDHTGPSKYKTLRHLVEDIIIK